MISFDALRGLLEDDRSVRRFDHSKPVSRSTLLQLVALVRLCASGRNAQPLAYRLVDSADDCQRLFPLLAWAGYYKDWDGPEPHQRPAAYLVQCLDTTLGSDCLCDDGLQLQAITLGATTLGLGCCIIKAFDPDKVAQALAIPGRYRPRYVLAVGVPAERTLITDLGPDGDFKYYRDETDSQCVPKRPVSQLIIK